MRKSETRCVEWPTVEQLRSKIDGRIAERGEFSNRTEALRRVDMSQTTFERLLREGLSDNPRKLTEKKLARMGVLDLIPRR